MNSQSTQNSQTISNLLEAIKIAASYYEKSQTNCLQELNTCHQAEQRLLMLERKLKNHMQDNNLEEINTVVRLIKKNPQVIVYDDNAVPLKYTTLQRRIDTIKIQKDLMKGEKIAGAYLENDSIELKLEITK